MNALNVLRDRTDVFTELELTRCLHLLGLFIYMNVDFSLI